jgi:hypothetical protein
MEVEMKYCVRITLILFLIFFFCCTKEENQPPYKPSAVYPLNGDVDIFIRTTLYWTASDPEGDPLTFDIHFGTTSPPPLMQSGVLESEIDPATLQYTTTYYWRIDAKDDQGNTTEGDVFEFVTMSASADFQQYYLATGSYTSIDGNYQDPDEDRGVPWISLSSHGSYGAEAQWEFYGFSKADVATLIVGGYSFDDGWDITGGEHYDLFNHETQEWDFLFDSNKQEEWHSARITGVTARRYVHDSTDVVILRLTSGYTDHTHIREIFCTQADLDTTAESETIPGTISIFGGMEPQETQDTH